ncbi:hypothetical protein VP395_03035 [Mariniflexile soesokkakense]|uniref:Lipoprotein n=1 Tax=Mariniflexile soesokkakense TaxID=1343160 RepID=A0ABV0A8W0_9FLAO
MNHFFFMVFWWAWFSSSIQACSLLFKATGAIKHTPLKGRMFSLFL